MYYIIQCYIHGTFIRWWLITCCLRINPIRTGFLPFTQKISLPEISWLFPTFGCGFPYEIFLSKHFVYTLWQHFCYTQYKNIFYFFALIRKVFLHTQVEIIFGYNYFFKLLLGTPLQIMWSKKSHIDCWV